MFLATNNVTSFKAGWTKSTRTSKATSARFAGDRLKKPIDEIAGGRVYTGRQALELGLVDRIGGLSDAISFVAKQAKLKEYEVRVEPRPKSFFEVLMEESAGGDGDQQISLRTLAGSWQTASLWKAVAPLVGNLEPHRLQALRRAFIQLEILQREGVTLATPEVYVHD